MKIINIVSSKNYNVLIGHNLLNSVGYYIREIIKTGKALIVTDDIVDRIYADTVESALAEAGFCVKRFVIEHGEKSKNAVNYISILNFAAEFKMCRSDTIVALGGGVVGDLAGFAAATLLRGVHLIQVPTTLLSAVDSSVGGKNAIDLDCGKNLAGTFYQPDLVICDTDTLKTLADDIFNDGMAEVIKYGVIRDSGLLDMLGSKDIDEIIARCVKIKAGIVAVDEHDAGIRQVLNFGHTVAHAVEAADNFNISHGKAVAVGMCVMAKASAKAGFCSSDVSDEIQSIVRRYGLPSSCPFGLDTIYSLALSDKKNTGHSITLIVPEKRGCCRLLNVSCERMREIFRLGLE